MDDFSAAEAAFDFSFPLWLCLGMAAPRRFLTLDPFLETAALGRSVANREFLRWLLTLDPFDEYHFFLGDAGARQAQERALAEAWPELAARGRLRCLERLDLPAALRRDDYFVCHLSDCINWPPHLARLRNALSRSMFPVTSLTHSLSYARYMREMLAHLWPGCTAKDVVVSTSVAGERAVQAYFRLLRQGYDLNPVRFPAPETRLIPLGVEVAAFAAPPERDRDRLRADLGLGPDQAAVLVFGRIAHFSKMDVLPLWRAFQRLFLSGLAPTRTAVILAGALDAGEDLLADLGRAAASLGLPLIVVPSPDEARKRELFAAADIFVSIADNPQETFGLTLVEAAAAGLPAVVSDYDGYRDTVRHGETGLLVPVAGPADTGWLDDLAVLTFDSQYHLLLAQQTAVDVAALAEALGRLIRDRALRLDMGAAARRRAALYDWPRIIERWVALWEELAARPLAAEERERLRGIPHPLHPRFAELFAGYPTAALAEGDLLVVSRVGQALLRGQEHATPYAGLGSVFDHALLRALLVLARRPIPAGELTGRLAATSPASPPEALSFHMLWALKHGFLERGPA